MTSPRPRRSTRRCSTGTSADSEDGWTTPVEVVGESMAARMPMPPTSRRGAAVLALYFAVDDADDRRAMTRPVHIAVGLAARCG